MSSPSPPQEEQAGAASTGAPPKARLRQRFGPNQDYLLAAQVKADRPFQAPYGALMAGWEKVATTLNDCSAFKMHHLKGPIAKNRFDRLVGRHRVWMGEGRVPEQAPSQDSAFLALMTELVGLMDEAAAAAPPTGSGLGKRGRPRKVDDQGVKRLARPVPIAAAPPGLRTSLEPSVSVTEGDGEPSTMAMATTAPSTGGKGTRQRFTPGDDLLLAKFVKEATPFRAKFGMISTAWENVAAQLNKCPEFLKDGIKGPTVRYRFENLVGKHRGRVTRYNGRVVGPKGAPAGELDLIMAELVALLDGGDTSSTNMLATNAVATARAVPRPVGDAPLVTPTPTPSFMLPQRMLAPARAPVIASGSVNASANANVSANASQEAGKVAASSVGEFKALLQEMLDQQTKSMEQMLRLHQQMYDQEREERRQEAERRQRELEQERGEREKDRQALTSAVLSAMQTFLDQHKSV